jgi:hypothetical protein
MVGTPKGEYLGRRLPEKQITYYGHDTVRFVRGKQVEHRDTFDLMGFLDKLGVPDPAMLERLRDSGCGGSEHGSTLGTTAPQDAGHWVENPFIGCP